MSDQIEVHVMKYGDRRHFIMYYVDPMTSKRHTRSTKTDKKKDADKAAAKWEAELREGRYRPLSNLTWEEFRERYESEVAPSMAVRTGRMIRTTFNAVERIVNPQRLRDLTEERLSHFQAQLREAKLAEPSIRSYLAHLKSALGWAADIKLLLVVPKMKMPKRAKGAKMMKGRPLYGDEYDRMERMVEAGLLLVTEERRVIGAKYPRRKDPSKPARKRSEKAKAADKARLLESIRRDVESWRRLLVGLRLSGLRLGEALNLSWDDESKIIVDLSGKRPMLRILAELEKGGRDRVHPITPDFAEFLEATAKDNRRGPVFTFPGGEVTVERASTVISAIGKAAGVLVDRDSGKFASAHDLRRTFGAKWSKIVMPAVLQQLMRHESIETTMRYYVGQNAESTADAIWEAVKRQSNSSCNSPSAHEKSDDGQSSLSLNQ